MKKFIITSILALLAGAGTIATAQNRPAEYLGLPGDNLNLYAVMKLFQESETLEGFERSLNDENSRINNLDLNGDNMIDYISVNDYVDRNVHTIVLQDALGSNEKQDVAVFTVQRFSDNSVQIQLVGDEALYGKNYIIEPIYADNADTPNPAYNGGTGVVRTTTYEIAAWPLIRFIYLPQYIGWRSSWYWGYYPAYWHPWRPFYWDFYYGYHRNWFPVYYGHYRHWNYNRFDRYNDFYYSGIRSHSQQVSRRISSGNYRATYSHPEQRRDGEALYSRMHSAQNSRRTDNGINNAQGRRPDSQTTMNRTSTGNRSGISRGAGSSSADRNRSYTNPGQRSGVSGRSAPQTTDRTGNRRYSGSNAATSQRSSEFAYNRGNTNPGQSQTSGTVRRASPSVNQRSYTNINSGQNSGNSRGSSTVNTRSYPNSNQGQSAAASRRSSGAGVERAVSRSGSGQRGESARTSRQSGSSVSSSGQRSSRNTSSSGNSGNRGSGNSRSSSRR